MKRILFLFLIIGIVFYNIDSRAIDVKRIDLKLKDDETSIVFLKLKNSNSLLINDEDSSNLFILDYKNDDGIDKMVRIFGCNPNIHFLKNNFDRRVSNIDVSFKNSIFKFRIDNYTLCVYGGNKVVRGCDFIYLTSIDEEFKFGDNVSAIFYDEGILDKWLRSLQESWVDNAIVETSSFTILKLYEDSYNILVVPSTNEQN